MAPSSIPLQPRGPRGEQPAIGLYAIALVMFCMVSSRLVGIVSDGDANAIMYAYLAAELVVLALALWAARSTTEPRRRESR